MKLFLEAYQTGWDKGWRMHEHHLLLEAHAPSRIVLRAGERGRIVCKALVKPGGRDAAVPHVNGRQVEYGISRPLEIEEGDVLELEARLQGSKDQCWNTWEIENAEVMLPNPLQLSFWERAHLGDSLGMLIACENFARANRTVVLVRTTGLFQAIDELFELNHVKLVPDSPGMIHVHPFGCDFEKLGWIGGITRSLCLATGGLMPEQINMPLLRRSRDIQKQDIVLCQFDSRSEGVWPRRTLVDFLKNYQGGRVAVLGGPDTSKYLGEDYEYRLGNLEYIADQLLSCRRFIGVDSGLAHLACILGLEIDLLPSPGVGRQFVRGVFGHYPKIPRFLDIKTASCQQRAKKRLLLVSTTNGWNLGDDLIRQGVMRLLNTEPFDPVIWLNRAQVNVADSDRKSSWTPLWKKLRNFGDPRSLVAHAKALVVAGTPEWIDTIQPYYRMAAQTGLPIYIIGVGGGQEGQLQHLKECHRQNPICLATVRDDAASRAMAWAGVPSARFLDPAFHADSYEPTNENWIVFNPRLQCLQHQEFYSRLYQHLRDFIDVISVHEQDEYTRACDLFDKPVFFHSDYRPYIQLYRSCSTYIGGRMHGAIPSLASGAKVHLICHERKHHEFAWIRERLDYPDALALWDMQHATDIGRPQISRHRFDQSGCIRDDFESHQKYLSRYTCCDEGA